MNEKTAKRLRWEAKAFGYPKAEMVVAFKDGKFVSEFSPNGTPVFKPFATPVTFQYPANSAQGIYKSLKRSERAWERYYK